MQPKLSTGEFLHTVKMYIFITNEYGKPTEGSIDLFIESFGALLLNKDFAIYDRVKNELDAWWKEVERDLQDRQLQSLIRYTGGFEWFKQLTIESKTLTKEQEEQFKNNRESFKEWIYNIEVESNNTELNNTDSSISTNNENCEDDNPIDIYRESKAFSTKKCKYKLDFSKFALRKNKHNIVFNGIHIELSTQSGELKVVSTDSTVYNDIVGRTYNSIYDFVIYIVKSSDTTELRKSSPLLDKQLLKDIINDLFIIEGTKKSASILFNWQEEVE